MGISGSLIARAAAVAVVALSGIGCELTPTSPSNNAPFSTTDVREGTGDGATSGQLLTVHYSGWFYDASKPDQKGPQFDSSIGSDAFTFTLGAGGVISGWDTGMAGMKVGGIRRLIIPPSLGYGPTRNGSIPPNATLLFEVELLQIGTGG